MVFLSLYFYCADKLITVRILGPLVSSRLHSQKIVPLISFLNIIPVTQKGIFWLLIGSLTQKNTQRNINQMSAAPALRIFVKQTRLTSPSYFPLLLLRQDIVHLLSFHEYRRTTAANKAVAYKSSI